MRTAQERHAAVVPAWIAAVAAAGAGALLHSASLATQAPDGVAELLWLLGWTLAAWAAIAAIAAVVLVWRGGERQDGSARASIALVAAALALLAITAWLHPIAGTGSGTG